MRANFNLTQLTSVFAVEPLVGQSFECVKLWLILLMAKILHQLIGNLSVYPIINKVLYISGWLSLGFLPSTECFVKNEAGIRGWRAFLKTKILPAIRKKLELSKHDSWSFDTIRGRGVRTNLKAIHSGKQKKQWENGPGWKMYFLLNMVIFPLLC